MDHLVNNGMVKLFRKKHALKPAEPRDVAGVVAGAQTQVQMAEAAPVDAPQVPEEAAPMVEETLAAPPMLIEAAPVDPMQLEGGEEEQPKQPLGGAGGELGGVVKNRDRSDKIEDHLRDIQNGTLKMLLKPGTDKKPDGEVVLLKDVETPGSVSAFTAFCRTLGVLQPKTKAGLHDNLLAWFRLRRPGQLTVLPSGGRICDVSQLACVCNDCLKVRVGAADGEIMEVYANVKGPQQCTK